MRSGSIRIGLGGSDYAYAEADDSLLTGIAKAKGWTYEFTWDDTGKPYMGIVPEDGGKPSRWISVVRGPRGEAQSTAETYGKTPFIKVLGEKPIIQQPLPKVQETILTSDLKKQVDVWGFDTMTADDKTGKVVKKKNWEQSLGLPNWGADASFSDMARWLLIFAAAGIAFLAVDFATKD